MRFSIMLKLVLIFTIVIIVPMAIITSVSMWITANRMEKDLQLVSIKALDNAKIILAEHAKRAENIAEILAESHGIKDRLGEAEEQWIQSDMEARQDMWFTAIVEIFDRKKRSLPVLIPGELRRSPFLPVPRTLLSPVLSIWKNTRTIFFPGEDSL